MPVKYVPYIPNTVEGQAVLDNITRTRRVLRYRDNDKVYDRIRRGMPYYEVETVEKIEPTPVWPPDRPNPSEEGNRNMVIRGECVSACAYLKEQGIKVDLVYIDPPFASGADYAKKVYIRRNPKLAEKLKLAEQENTPEGGQVDIEGLRAFEEKMYGDIWKKEDYLNWMYENLLAIKSVMSDNASIYVHLDWHIGHYVKILMDEVFGEDNFRNEIVWKRSTAHSDSSGFANLHDTIFYFTHGDEFYFETQYVPYSDDYIKTYYRHKDGKRLFLDRDLSAKGLQGAGYSYRWNGKDGYWRCPIETMQKYHDEGRLYLTNNGTPRYKQYLDEMPGTSAQDLWTDIYAVNSQAKERLDYSTQKPEALLERIIKASSNEGMVVADFLGGSGVTAKVANDLGRKFIHVDVGLNSIQTTRDRLIESGAEFQIMEIKDGVSLFRNPAQTMDKLAKLIPGLQQNISGLGKFWFGAIQDSKLGSVPVYVPDLKDSKVKVLDIPLVNKIINQEIQNLEIDAKKVIVYYVDITDYKEIEKFIKENNATEMMVELKDLKNILDEVIVEDFAEFKLAESKGKYELEIIRFVSDRLMQKISAFNQKGNLQSLSSGREFKSIQVSEEGLELIELISLDCSNKTDIWQSDSEIKIDKLGYVAQNGKKSKEFWDGKIQSDEKPKRLKIRNISGDESIYGLIQLNR